MRYYLYIILIMGFVLGEGIHKNELFTSINISDLGQKMADDNSEGSISSNSYAFSIGYNRVDLKGSRSGIGFEYIFNINRDEANLNSAYYKNLFGLSLISFFNTPIFKIEDKNQYQLNIGAKSYFDFGLTNNNFAIGPTFGLSMKVYKITLNLNYFIGCLDLDNFSKYTNQIDLGLSFQYKG